MATITFPSSRMPAGLEPSPQDSRSPELEPVTHDLFKLKTWIVNCYFYGEPGGKDFVLVDTGMPGWANEIAELAEQQFGPGARPPAIVLTHGHFDHVGNVMKLAERWDVPVFAHRLELPYLTGRSDYPPADPSVGGGMMARTGFLFPRRGIDLGGRVRTLPEDGAVPFMPHWRWIHTPGHTPGHVSLFRDDDRCLIAGDAFIATQQESLLSVMMQEKQMHGPPMYFTQDWISAAASVRELALLDPRIAATGHGPIMRGQELRVALSWLADEFEVAAVPDDGRYVREPARADERGTYYVPPPVFDPVTYAMIGGAVLGAGALLYKLLRPNRRSWIS